MALELAREANRVCKGDRYAAKAYALARLGKGAEYAACCTAIDAGAGL